MQDKWENVIDIACGQLKKIYKLKFPSECALIKVNFVVELFSVCNYDSSLFYFLFFTYFNLVSSSIAII